MHTAKALFQVFDLHAFWLGTMTLFSISSDTHSYTVKSKFSCIILGDLKAYLKSVTTDMAHKKK